MHGLWYWIDVGLTLWTSYFGPLSLSFSNHEASMTVYLPLLGCCKDLMSKHVGSTEHMVMTPDSGLSKG